MKLNLKKGFTLIELLVVIAIIGILSAIVLTSLGTARNKAKVASAQASMSSMRAEAELGVSANGQYIANICAVSSGTGRLTALLAAVNGQGIGTAVCDHNGAAATDTSTLWAVELDYTDSIQTGYFCVDSSGFAGARTTAKGAAATVCAAL